MPPKLDPKVQFVLTKIDRSMAWEQEVERQRDTHFVELGPVPYSPSNSKRGTILRRTSKPAIHSFDPVRHLAKSDSFARCNARAPRKVELSKSRALSERRPSLGS